ncbi:MAG: hypothetical protein ABI811_01790 [Acidobacteriota bacterium]
MRQSRSALAETPSALTAPSPAGFVNVDTAYNGFVGVSNPFGLLGAAPLGLGLLAKKRRRV